MRYHPTRPVQEGPVAQPTALFGHKLLLSNLPVSTVSNVLQFLPEQLQVLVATSSYFAGRVRETCRGGADTSSTDPGCISCASRCTCTCPYRFCNKLTPLSVLCQRLSHTDCSQSSLLCPPLQTRATSSPHYPPPFACHVPATCCRLLPPP